MAAAGGGDATGAGVGGATGCGCGGVGAGAGVAAAPQLGAGTAAAVEAPVGRREVVVRFRDSAANDVRIAGDFNGWVPDKGVRSLIESDGPTRVWTKILQLAPGTYQYRYVVDGTWREDPENPQLVTSAAGGRNSVLVVR